MLAVRALYLDTRQGDDVLEESLLEFRRNLVELVEVYQQKLTHGLQRLSLLADIQLVGISPLQVWRKKRLDEGRLVPALFRDEQRGYLVAVTVVDARLPLMNHS